MKNKHLIFIFLLGFCFTFIGSLFKLMHWPFSNILLTLGVVIKVYAILYFGIKLLKNKEVNDFLNK